MLNTILGSRAKTAMVCRRMTLKRWHGFTSQPQGVMTTRNELFQKWSKASASTSTLAHQRSKELLNEIGLV